MTSPPPPVGVVGNGYLHQFKSSLPTPDPVFTVTAGALPPGLALLHTGFLTGAPAAAGIFGPTTVCGSALLSAPACQTFTIEIRRRTPGIIATMSPGGAVGTRLRIVASLVGAFLPTGSMTFRLFRNASCTQEAFSSTNPLAVAVGVAGSATSDEFAPTVPGLYWWAVTYSGDANNEPVSLPCDSERVVAITGPTTPGPTTTSSTTSSSTSSTSTSAPSTTTSSTTPTTTTTSTSTTTTSTSTTTTTRPPTTTTTSTTTTVAPTTTTTSTSSTTTTTLAPTTTTTRRPPPATTSTTRAPTTTTTAAPDAVDSILKVLKALGLPF